jgi:hypothetical protein
MGLNRRSPRFRLGQFINRRQASRDAQSGLLRQDPDIRIDPEQLKRCLNDLESFSGE